VLKVREKGGRGGEKKSFLPIKILGEWPSAQNVTKIDQYHERKGKEKNARLSKVD